MPYVFDLEWEQVDPRRISFEPGSQLPAIAADIGALVSQRGDGWRSSFVEAVTSGLVRRLGDWAVGWSFSVGEGSCGGVVQAWCCPSHSLPKTGRPDAQALARMVDAALNQWRAHLEVLASEFAKVDLSSDDPVLAQLELDEAVGRVLDLVIAATVCEDAWYSFAETAVAWLLEAKGLAAAKARGAAAEALGGRFESWVAPPDPVRKQCQQEVARLAIERLR